MVSAQHGDQARDTGGRAGVVGRCALVLVVLLLSFGLGLLSLWMWDAFLAWRSPCEPCWCSSTGERLPCKQRDAGSSPAASFGGEG